MKRPVLAFANAGFFIIESIVFIEFFYKNYAGYVRIILSMMNGKK